MEFFNRKEEVLEIQLTQRGKKLLSEGEFKPYYYEFFDDDLLYDTTGCGFTEEQNSSIPRIKETPRIKTQNIVHGVETEFNIEKQSKYPDEVKKAYLHNKNHEPLRYALGIADYSKSYAPAWNLSLKTGELVTGSFSQTYSPEDDYYEYIPQLQCTCSYLYESKKNKDVEYYLEEQSDTMNDKIYHKSDLFEDQTYYTIRQKNNLHIILSELNSIFDKENFDIEIFEVEKVEKQKDNLNKLTFNNIFYEIEDNFINIEINESTNINKNDVEWYFSISDDQTIMEEEQAILPTGDMIDFVDYNAENSENPC